MDKKQKIILGSGILIIIALLIINPFSLDAFGWGSTGEGCIKSIDRAEEIALDVEGRTTNTCTITRIHMIKGYPYCMDANVHAEGVNAEHYLIYCSSGVFEWNTGGDEDNNRCEIDDDCNKIEAKEVLYWRWQVKQSVVFSNLQCIEGRCKAYLEPEPVEGVIEDDEPLDYEEVLDDEEEEETGGNGLDLDIDNTEDEEEEEEEKEDDTILDEIKDFFGGDDKDETIGLEEPNNTGRIITIFLLVIVSVIAYLVYAEKVK